MRWRDKLREPSVKGRDDEDGRLVGTSDSLGLIGCARRSGICKGEEGLLALERVAQSEGIWTARFWLNNPLEEVTD